jgi:hypothetical protein
VAAFTRNRALFASFLATAVTAVSACSDRDRERDGFGADWASAVALRPVTRDVHAVGAARLVRRASRPRLELRVKGLPPLDGAYVVWAYNSVFDAVGVARVARGSFALRARLPRDLTHYRYIDISREPLNGNRLHSGASVLRVRMSRLLAAAGR